MLAASCALALAAQQPRLSLHAFAHLNGGLIFGSTRDLDRQIDSCLASAGSGYSLAFLSSASSGVAQLHSLKLRLGTPGIAVRVALLYYAQP